MFNKHIALWALVLSVTSLYGQEIKKEAEKTKMDIFTSKTGTITKFTDTKLSGIRTYLGGVAETRIRAISNGGPVMYFYQIGKEGKYGTSTASIEYNDLIEVIKALKSLKSEQDKDVASNPDYLENKFVTVDGFQVGYYVNKGKASWYLKLEKFGSDNTLFIDNGNTVEAAFNEAKNKIDELRK